MNQRRNMKEFQYWYNPKAGTCHVDKFVTSETIQASKDAGYKKITQQQMMDFFKKNPKGQGRL